MRPRPWLAAPAIVALAARRFGSGSAAHPTLTEKQALRQARADGFTQVGRESLSSWYCDGKEVGDAATARRCARSALYATDHVQVTPFTGRTRLIPHRMVSPVTMQTNMHQPKAGATVYHHDGEYDTYIARGRVLAEGLAYTGPTSRIVEADLARIASEIAG